MNSLHDVLHEALDPVRLPPGSIERTIRIAERRQKRHRVSAAVAGLAVFLAGGVVLWSIFQGNDSLPGSGPSQSEGLFFPTYEPSGEVPGAILEGQLVEQHGCLFVFRAEGNTHHLPLWPNGYETRLSDGVIEVYDDSGARVGSVRDFISVGGGEINPAEVGGQAEADALAQDLVGHIPESCMSEHLYWTINPSQ